MMQIGEIPPVPAVPNGLPADAGFETRPQPTPSDDEDREVFVSPPAAPWPRVFPGL
jgi:hypothetical protein